MVDEGDLQLDSGFKGVKTNEICPCETLADFDEWAPGPEGLRKVKRALVEAHFTERGAEVGRQWVAIRTGERIEVLAVVTARTASRAASASERAAATAEIAASAAGKSARWTMFAAIASGVSALAAAITVAIITLGPK